MNNGKVRIYELSKELNLDNKELLAICDQLEIAVKSHSSTISESEAERIRTAAEKLTANNLKGNNTSSKLNTSQPGTAADEFQHHNAGYFGHADVKDQKIGGDSHLTVL